MYLYVYFLLNTMTLLKKNIFYYQINTKFFYSISKRILVYSVNKKHNTLKPPTQHVVFAKSTR